MFNKRILNTTLVTLLLLSTASSVFSDTPHNPDTITYYHPPQSMERFLSKYFNGQAPSVNLVKHLGLNSNEGCENGFLTKKGAIRTFTFPGYTSCYEVPIKDAVWVSTNGERIWVGKVLDEKISIDNVLSIIKQDFPEYTIRFSDPVVHLIDKRNKRDSDFNNRYLYNNRRFSFDGYGQIIIYGAKGQYEDNLTSQVYRSISKTALIYQFFDHTDEYLMDKSKYTQHLKNGSKSTNNKIEITSGRKKNLRTGDFSIIESAVDKGAYHNWHGVCSEGGTANVHVMKSNQNVFTWSSMHFDGATRGEDYGIGIEGAFRKACRGG